MRNIFLDLILRRISKALVEDLNRNIGLLISLYTRFFRQDLGNVLIFILTNMFIFMFMFLFISLFFFLGCPMGCPVPLKKPT